MLVSGFSAAAPDVKGCLCHLCVLGSLAGSQAVAHCVRSHCRAAEVTRAEGRLREGCQGIVDPHSNQQSRSSPWLLMLWYLWWRHVCVLACVHADALITHSLTHTHSVELAHVCTYEVTHLLPSSIAWSLWRWTQCLPSVMCTCVGVTFETVVDRSVRFHVDFPNM